ncbi:hypothetical protein GOODEAATRI_015823 [Goodea atripinnis]|uniref:Uncharacterized protein n=1 Tax=Goodea atripinnis TaxID=208336 RepID=A0ABV0NKM9_9TELE
MLFFNKSRLQPWNTLQLLRLWKIKKITARSSEPTCHNPMTPSRGHQLHCALFIYSIVGYRFLNAVPPVFNLKKPFTLTSTAPVSWVLIDVTGAAPIPTFW